MIYIFLIFILGLFSSISLMDGFHTLMLLIVIKAAITNKFKTQNNQQQFDFHESNDVKRLWKLCILWGLWVLLCYWVNPVESKWRLAFDNLRWMFFIPATYYFVLNFVKSKFPNKIKFGQLKGYSYFLGCFLVLFVLYTLSVALVGKHWLMPHRNSQLHPLSTYSLGVRATGFFDNPMTFAHSFGVWICFFWGLLIVLVSEKFQKYKKQFLLFILVFILMFLCFFLSFTRGAWLSVGLAIFVTTFLHHRRWAKYLLFLGLGVGFLSFALSPALQERLLDVLKFKDSQSERLTLWSANAHIIKDHPVFGVGHGQNFNYLDHYYSKMGVPQDFFKSHAHNEFLQMAAGSGILGLLFYVLFLGILFKIFLTSYIQNKKNKNIFLMSIALSGVAIVIHIFWGGLFEANFEDTETLHNFCFAIGFLLALKNLYPVLGIELQSLSTQNTN